jgi:hypothetical protein
MRRDPELAADLLGVVVLVEETQASALAVAHGKRIGIVWPYRHQPDAT